MADLRTVLRPLLLLLTALTVLLALVTTVGRVLVAALPRLEPSLGSMLAARGIEATGLRGGWHLLNPVVHVDRLRFPGGAASDVTMELDVVESVLRGAPVARHLEAARVELEPVRDTDGHWHLGSQAGEGGGTPILPLLRYSDALEFGDVRIGFAASSTTARASTESLVPLGEVRGRLRLANSGLRHSGEIVVRIERGGSGELRLAYDLLDGLFGRPTNGRLACDAQGFAIAPGFGLAIGGGGIAVDRLHAHWSFADANSTGELALTAHDVTLPSGALNSIDAQLRGTVDRLGRRWEFAVDRLSAASAHGTTHLDGATFAVTPTSSGVGSIEFKLPSFDAAELIGVVRDGAVHVRGVDQWLGGLAPRGRVDRARGRFDVDAGELDYVAAVDDLALANFQGVPQVANARATVSGTEHSLAIALDADQAELGFLDYFAAPTKFDRLTGEVLIYFVPGYLAVQGRDLAGTFGTSTLHGSFSIGRPADPLEQRIFLNLRLSDIDGRKALEYVPRELPEPLLRGLDQAIVGGHVDAADLVYHGHLRTIEGLPMRQVELRVALHDAVVRFHPDWPVATGVVGEVLYKSAGMSGQFETGRVVGIEVSDATVAMPAGSDVVEFAGHGSGNGTLLRGLIDGSPLATWLSFVKPEWSFAGPFDYSAKLRIPMGAAAPPEVDLHFSLGGLNANLADMKLDVGSLRGKLHYRYPADVDGESISGTLFGHPSRFKVQSADGAVRLGFSGRAAVRAITDWRALPNRGLADGDVEFTGEYRIRPGSDEPATLAVRSDLRGVALALPAELGKAAEDERPSTLTFAFDGDRERLDVEFGDVGRGWLRIVDGKVSGGSIGIGVDPSAERGDEDAVTIDGSLSALDLTSLLRGGPTDSYPSFTWGMNAFSIGRVTYRTLAFEHVVADVWSRAGTFDVSVTAPDIEGSMVWAPSAPPSINVHYVRLPAAEGQRTLPDADPLADVDPRGVTDLDVVATRVSVGEEAFGDWRFKTRRIDGGVAVDELAADVKGLRIDSASGTRWTAADGGRTRFAGHLHADNLATVLPQWNYAPSLETESTDVEADLEWPGSPLNFALLRLAGKVSLKAKQGRFVDLGEGSGAARVFSLLNFAAIAKRMTLDFSDVFGKGISFDRIDANVTAERGTITFVDPMEIDGTGGNYRITGKVDLVNGTLDNEMVVTLPVSSSLPWYAAYLGFVNPLAAGAVLVGERIFRSQIDQFSSAKYKIGGTLQNPDVNFEEVFPKALAEPPTPAAAAPSPVTPPPVVAPTETTTHDAPTNAQQEKKTHE